MEKDMKKTAVNLISIANDIYKHTKKLRFYEIEGKVNTVEYQGEINLFRLTYADLLNTLSLINYDIEQWDILITIIKHLTSEVIENSVSQLIAILEMKRDQLIYDCTRSLDISIRVLAEKYDIDIILRLLAKITKVAKENSYYDALLVGTIYDKILRYQIIYRLLFFDDNLSRVVPDDYPLLSNDMIVLDELSDPIIKKANFDALVYYAMDSIDYLLTHDSSKDAYSIMYFQLLLESVLDLAEPMTMQSIYTYFDEEVNNDNSLLNVKKINDLFIAARKTTYYMKHLGFISCEEKEGVSNE